MAKNLGQNLIRIKEKLSTSLVAGVILFLIIGLVSVGVIIGTILGITQILAQGTSISSPN